MMGWLIRRLAGAHHEPVSHAHDEVLKEHLKERADVVESRVREQMFEAQESVLRRDARRRGRRKDD